MLTVHPFRANKPNPKSGKERRVRDRVRYYGAERQQERERVFRRSGGRCEEILPTGERCPNEITLFSMHWSHDNHGPRKDDLQTKASCADCHHNRHNAGGKPVRKKPGRVMKKAEAQAYLRQTACFCDGHKRRDTPFCDACLEVLGPQAKLDLAELSNSDWLQCVADCELELMRR